MKTTVYNSNGSVASQTNTKATSGGSSSGGTVASNDISIVTFGACWDRNYNGYDMIDLQRTVQAVDGQPGNAAEIYVPDTSIYIAAISLKVDGSVSGDTKVQFMKNFQNIGDPQTVITGVGYKRKTFTSSQFTFAADDYLTAKVMNTSEGNFQVICFLKLVSPLT